MLFYINSKTMYFQLDKLIRKKTNIFEAAFELIRNIYIIYTTRTDPEPPAS